MVIHNSLQQHRPELLSVQIAVSGLRVKKVWVKRNVTAINCTYHTTNATTISWVLTESLRDLTAADAEGQ